MRIFNIHARISIPFVNSYKILYNQSGNAPFPNKYWDFTIYNSDALIELEFDSMINDDHEGFNFTLALFGIACEFEFYDCRHWDYENNCWEVNK